MKVKHSLLALLSLALGACGGTPGSSEQTQTSVSELPKPNVIMIVIDDLGWADVGYNQTTDLFETPNIDAFAKQSLRFDNAYAGAANCAPSRAVLMSGQYGPRHGVYTVSPSARGNAKTRKLIPIKNTRGISTEIITMAETLKTAGYTTGNFGKWHLGADPDKQGFDVNVAGSHQGMTFHYFSPYNLPNIKDGPEGEYLTDRLTTEVIDWVKSVKDKPFFVYLPYYTVHTPYQAVLDKVQKYHDKGIKEKRQATYAAMVESMDTNVGRIFSMLEAEKLDENTLVIFTSDNGGYRMSSFPSPIRGGKGSYYDGGIKVPLLVRWPGKIKPGINPTPVTNADFYPTLTSLTKADKPNQILDGMDLSSVLLNQETKESRDLFWHFPVYLQAHHAPTDQGQDPLFRTRPGSAIRSGNWKLIQYFENNEYELYDLANDVGETNNLAAQNPAKLNELKSKLEAWQQEIGAAIPTELNPEYDEKVNQAMIKQVLLKTKH
ncbi:sulfatase [Catenovulum maritimum]|uniref:Aryl-sulfate sulfohydrolase n=1 Tax=Catenovulum maritimum TaxID=1513271 RepID=A0A0J8GPV2_9ALTE|nr:sulfatase [Catenovulum maritimum]KMT64830.1 aryl-sulfate sulfohydrolase [Catenovulum maritimum]